MHLSDLYRNPAVDSPCYVHAKVVEVQIEDYVEGLRVYIQMRIPPEQPRLSGRHLYAVLHPCLSAEYPRKKFREAFDINENDFKQAEGQWAAVRLVPAEYDGTRFSNVQFVAQTPISRSKSRRFAELEASGAFPPWHEEPVFAH